MKNLEINIGGRKTVVPRNVILFEGDVNYCHVYLKNGVKLTVATTLKMLEQRFKPHNFYRSHKKYLVNIKEVKSCERDKVLLSNKQNVLVSRRKKEELLNRLNVRSESLN